MDFQDLVKFIKNPTNASILALAILGAFFIFKEVIAYLQNNIFPQYYKWYLERQKVILPFAEKVLDKEWKEPAFFRSGTPKFIDFERSFVLKRPEVEIIQGKLKRHRFVHIEGLPASGKSTIALTIAYKELKAKHTVIYFSRPTVIPENFFDNLLVSLRSRLDKKNVLIIVDDVHLDISTASKLFTIIYSGLENANLLFVSRPLTVQHDDDLDEWQYSFIQYMPKVEITADSAIAQMPDFYALKKYGQHIPPILKNLFINECGNDVLLLGRYLSEWNGKSPVNLDEIRNAVFKKVYGDLEHMKQYSPDAVKVLLVLGVFYRFEIRVEERFFSSLNLDISFLTRTGEIRLENGYAMLYHSSLAKLYSNVIRELEMPDYNDFSVSFSPFPLELFKRYVSSLPRNLSEMVIGLRFAPTMLSGILRDVSLTESIRTCLERDQNITMLGWALVILKACDGGATWRILESTNFDYHVKHVANLDNPGEATMFIYNLSKVSDIKLKEWITGMPFEKMTEILLAVEFRALTLTLLKIKKTNQDYFHRLLEHISSDVICEKFLGEQSLDKLRINLSILPKLLRGYVDIRSATRTDFAGERHTKISLYIKNKRVSRTISGQMRGIPYSNSHRSHKAYQNWLWDNRKKDSFIVIDKGAERALINLRASLFPAGITAINGDFGTGEIIEIRNQDGNEVGVGVVNYSSQDLSNIKGLRSDQIQTSYPKLSPNRVIDNDLLVLVNRLEKESETEKMAE